MTGFGRSNALKGKTAMALFLAGILALTSIGNTTYPKARNYEGDFSSYVKGKTITYSHEDGSLLALEEGVVLSKDTAFYIEYDFVVPGDGTIKSGSPYEVKLPALLMPQRAERIPINAISAWGESARIGELELTEDGSAKVFFDGWLEPPVVDSGWDVLDSGYLSDTEQEGYLGVWKEESSYTDDQVLYLDEEPQVKSLIRAPRSIQEEQKKLLHPEAAILDSGLGNSPAWSGRITVPCVWDMDALQAAIEGGEVRLDGKAVLVSMPIPPMLTTPKADYTMGNYITKGELYKADNKKQPLSSGAEVYLDDGLSLYYYFALSKEQVTEISATPSGTKYTVPQPPTGLKWVIAPNTPSAELKAGGSKFGELHLSGEGAPYVTFVDNLETIESNKFADGINSGYLEISCQLDNAAIGDKKQVEIDLLSAGKFIFVVGDNKDKEPVLSKQGRYNDGRITWTMEVIPARPNLSLTLKDIYSDTQFFVEDSFQIDGVKKAVTHDAGTKALTYPLSKEELAGKTKVIIIYDTVLTDKEYFESNLGISESSAKNQAWLLKEGTGPELSKQTAEVKVTAEEKSFLKKTGRYLENEKCIEWTVKLFCQDRKLTNLVLYDTMDTGLTLTADSITALGQLGTIKTTPGDTISGVTNGFSLVFQEPLKTQYTITYKTSVGKDFYEKPTQIDPELKNHAWLTFDWKGYNGVGEGSYVLPHVELPQQITNNAIRKEGVKYDPSTEEITWRITVNSNKMDIAWPCTVTDDFQTNKQEFVKLGTVTGGTVTTNSGHTTTKGDFNISATNPKDTVAFEVVTKITDRNVTTSNTPKKGILYQNTAILKATLAGAAQDLSVTATIQVHSKMIEKLEAGYDYTTKEATWKMILNQNQMPLEDVKVIDALLPGLSYVTGSAKLYSGAGDTTGTAITPTIADQTVTFSVGNIQDFDAEKTKRQKTIEFKTLVDVDAYGKDASGAGTSAFLENEDVTLGNQAKVTSKNSSTVEVADTAEIKIANRQLNKVGELNAGDGIMNYALTLNANGMDLKGTDYDHDAGTALKLKVEDILSSSLRIRMDSIKLYPVTPSATGEFPKVSDTPSSSPVDGSKVVSTYDPVTRKLTIGLEVDSKQVYQLRYTADITQNAKLTNAAKLVGSNSSGDASAGFDQELGGSGGGALAGKGSITIYKIDSLRPDVKLKNVEFALYDSFGNQIDQMKTDVNGVAKFSGLAISSTYGIKEVGTKVAGYSDGNYYKGKLDTPEALTGATAAIVETVGQVAAVCKVQVGAGTAKNVELTRTNRPVTVSSSSEISFLKVNNFGEELTGATFEIAAETPNTKYLPAAAKAPIVNGAMVTFNLADFPFGVYKLVEKTTPPNYTALTEKLTFTIDENGTVGSLTGTAVGSKVNGSGTIQTVINTEKSGKLTLTDMDSKRRDILINGVEFQIEGVKNGSTISPSTDSSHEFFHETSYPGEKSTDGGGKVTLDSLRPGKTYRITVISTEAELKALGYKTTGGYRKTETSGLETETGYFECTIPTGENKAVSVIREHDPMTGTVTFKKITQHGAALSDVGFTLKEDFAGIRMPYTATSGGDGIITFANVPYGTYKLTETTVPEGYEAAPVSLVTVGKDGTVGVINKETDNTPWGFDPVAPTYQAIVNRELEGSITLMLKDELRPGRVLPQRTMTLIKLNQDGTQDGLLKTGVTDTAGYIKFTELEIGREFELRQTDTKGRYHNKGIYVVGANTTNPAISTEVFVKVKLGRKQDTGNTDNSSDRIFTRTNVPYAGNVSFQKENPWARPLAGAVFTLTESSPAGGFIKQVSSNETGKVLFETVPEGSYILEEKTAPAGYLRAQEVFTVEITADQATVAPRKADGTPVSSVVNAFDPNKLGSITVYVTDNVQPEMKLENASFVLRDSTGVIRGTETATDTSGKLTFQNLMLGETYTLEETAVPPGYQMPQGEEAQRAVVITGLTSPNGWNVEVRWKNILRQGDISFRKASPMDGSFEEPVAGAIFGIYPETGAMIDTTRLKQATSSKEGGVLFQGMPVGSYRIREEKAPSNFRPLAPEIFYTVSIDVEGVATPLLNQNGAPVPESKILNEAKTGSVTIEKTGAVANQPRESVKLPGVKFALFLGETEKAQEVTDEKGLLTFTGLLYDKTYTVKELEAPAQYVVQGEKGVTVTAGTPEVHLDWHNSLRLGAIRLRSISIQQRPLVGVRYAIYSANDTEMISPLKTVLSDEQGQVVFEDMPVGNYLIRQEETPPGHLPNSTVYKTEITEEGTCPGLSDLESDDPPTDEVVNALPPPSSGGGSGGGSSGGGPTVSPGGKTEAGKADQPGIGGNKGSSTAVGSPTPNPVGKNQVVLKKKTSEGVALEGAVFAVFNKNGEKVAEAATNQQGEVYFYGLEMGVEYAVVEVRPAPGYEADPSTHGFSAGEEEITYESTAHISGTAGNKRPPVTGR